VGFCWKGKFYIVWGFGIFMRWLVVLVLAFGLVGFVGADVIFEDDFDSHNDWISSVQECGEDCLDAPLNWTFYRSTGSWEPPIGEPTISINDNNSRGESGKAFTVWTESRPGQSGWGADGMISVLLPKDYSEIYARVWIRYDSTWQAPSPLGDMMIKTFRIMHYDRSGNPFSFFSSGNSCPVYLYDLKNSNTYGTRLMHSFRCDSQETDYYCGNNDYMIEETDFAASLYNDLYEPGIGDPHSYNDLGMPADGSWHSYDWHIKMNSYNESGAWNADGVLQFWIDEVLQADISAMRWVEGGTDSTIGWNTIGLGGNAYNTYANESLKQEQWYAFDDFVIYTPIDNSSEYWNDSPADGRLPLDYVIGNAAVTNCVDEDNDGYGIGVDCLGIDCDNNNSEVFDNINCIYDGNVCGNFSLCTSFCSSVPEEICGNEIDEDCDGVAQNCSCLHEADLEPCDGNVSTEEMIAYMERWVVGEVFMGDVVDVVNFWSRMA
jgi:hypothetical protein